MSNDDQPGNEKPNAVPGQHPQQQQHPDHAVELTEEALMPRSDPSATQSNKTSIGDEADPNTGPSPATTAAIQVEEPKSPTRGQHNLFTAPAGGEGTGAEDETRAQLLEAVQCLDTQEAPWLSNIAQRGARPEDGAVSTPTEGIKIGFNDQNILIINIRGAVSRWDVLAAFIHGLLLALILVVMWLALGPLMQPQGEVFSPTITILFGALVGTGIAKLTGWPTVTGIFIAGIIWNALPQRVSGGTPALFITIVRKVALAAILCRAGINFKWSVVKPVLLNLVLLACAPQITELVTHAVASKFLFNHATWSAAFLEGAVAAPVANSIMLPCVSVFRNEGYSVNRGPSLMMMVGGAFDNVFAVWLINFILGAMYPTSDNEKVWLRIVLAPVQVIAGAIVGYLVGLFTVTYINHYTKRTTEQSEANAAIMKQKIRRDTVILVLFAALANIYFTEKMGFPGAGTVAAAVSAATISHLWIQQGQESRKLELNKDMAAVWDAVIAPSLYSLVGSSVNLATLVNGSFLGPALGCIFAGLVAKTVACILILHGTGCTWKERLFCAIGFYSKATVQAALGGQFFVLAQLHATDAPTDDGSPASQLRSAQIVQQVAVLAIVVGALGSGITMNLVGRKLLIKDEDYARKQKLLGEKAL